MKRKIIAGFGNAARSDDGIGLRIVEHIAEKNLDTGFEAVEVGNDGMKLLAILSGNDVKMLLVIDCAKMGLAPGEFRIFTPDEVKSVKETERISTHEGDVMKVLDMGKKLGIEIPEVKIMAIEPESMDMEMSLSSGLERRMGEYVNAAIGEIRIQDGQ